MKKGGGMKEMSGRTASLRFPASFAFCLFTSSLILLPSTFLQAQDQTTATGPTGPAPLTPATPGTFDYQNASVESLLDLYENLSGMHLIRDANIAGLPNVSVNMTGLSKPEMTRFIRAFLQLNGVSFLPIDENTEKVVTTTANKNLRSEGTKVYTRVDDLPTDDTVVTYFMPLDYIPPQEAANIFTLTAPVHSYGAYTPAPSAQGIILTEEASVVRELIDLKNLIDVPPAKVTTEFVTLNRADSDTVVGILDKMLNIGPNGQPAVPAGPTGQVIVRPEIGNRAPLSDEKNLISGPANIVSDPRSNRVIITTRPVNMPFLQEVITQLDQPNLNMVPQRRELKYVTAGDILPALEAALAEGKDQLQQVQKDQQTAQNSQNRNGTGGATGGTAAPTSTAGASSGGGTTVNSITAPLTAPQENDVPTVLTIGNTRLMADNHSNSIIVFGSPDVVGRVFQMIDQLDRKPLQVYLRTVIGELTVTQDVQFGLDLLQKFQKVGQGGLATSNVNSPGVGSTVSGSTVGNGTFPEPRNLTASNLFSTMPTGLTLYGAIGSTLDAYLSALQATDRFKIISTPSVYTSNNKLAVIADGEQVPVPSNITSGFVTGNDNLTTTASVSYEDVLLQLDIIPLINADHEVTLQIRQTNNSLAGDVSISGNEVPNIATQEINTEVTVPNRSTVVIGGLIRETTERDAQGLPWLSDIPVLGYLFGAVDKAKKREELIIMIEPTVVANDADQLAVNQEENQRTILGREAVEAATGTSTPKDRPIYLPFAPGTPESTIITTTTATPTEPNSAGQPFSSKGIYYAPGTTPPTATTTTTVTRIPPRLEPVGPGPSVSPIASPDVQYGKMPPVNPPAPGSTPPPTQTP
jgi:type II secretion system protein D